MLYIHHISIIFTHQVHVECDIILTSLIIAIVIVIISTLSQTTTRHLKLALNKQDMHLSSYTAVF